jgi:hypothetical protein
MSPIHLNLAHGNDPSGSAAKAVGVRESRVRSRRPLGHNICALGDFRADKLLRHGDQGTGGDIYTRAHTLNLS